jgi:hypothetical protein
MAKKKQVDWTAYLAKAEADFAQAHAARIEAEDRYYEEVEKPALHKLVGKCFRYRNCYSCPQPDEYWYRYYIVTGVEDATVRAIACQIDKDGKAQVEHDRVLAIGGEPMSGFVPVPRGTFDREYRRTLRALTPTRKAKP